MNVCGACGLDFSSVRAFDSHRVGRHGFTLAEGLRRGREVGRRCLVVHELCDVGFAQDGRGRWGLVAHRDGARLRFSVGPDMAEAA